METNFIDPYLETIRKRSRLLDYLIKAASAVVFIATIPEIIYFVTDTLLIVSFILLGFFTSYLLNKKGHTNLAANIIAILVSVMVFIQCIKTGLGSMVFCYYMPLVIGIPFIIDHKKIGFLLIHMLTPVVICAYLFFGNPPFSNEAVALDQGFNHINGRLNILCALIQCGFFAWLIIRDHYISQKLAVISKQKIEARNQDLSKTNKEMDHLVYSISHDLRAPIASALGLIEISKIENDIEKLRYYETLKEACLKRLDHFIIDILNYLKNNRLELEISPVNVAEEISFAVEMNSGYNESMNIVIENSITEDFYTDKNRLRIILNNLISNAFRYAKQGTAERRLNILAKETGEDMYITIADNGIGISNEYIDKIFNMFFKTDEKSKGSGLGLYITKEALEKLNGSIKVWSEKGIGSSFTIRLPNMKNLVGPILSKDLSI